jgi:protoporphyrinogen oxidase
MPSRVVILGAGLAGLSTAFHLENDYLIFEKESEVGGMARSVEINGFTFDFTGHLLHLRNQYTKDLVAQLLPDAFETHSRQAYIYSNGVYTEYPFQANTYGLPKDVVKECIAGFVETCLQSSNSNGNCKPDNLSFEDWVYRTFGSGIAKHFMLPYNQKLWHVPLKEIAADWVSWSVPRPNLDEILNGALGLNNRAFGYNPSFLYPKSGGIGQLPQSMCGDIKNLHLNKSAIELSLQQRTIRFDDGSVYSYDNLVSTIPLVHLLKIIRDLPEEVRNIGKKLRYLSVYDINLGVKRPNISDKHWLYFPEREFIFYRVGFPMNYAPHTVPQGCSSMYVEVSHLPGENIPEEQLLDEVIAGLNRCGILRADDELLVRQVIDLKCAYVIHDLNRQEALQVIHPYLESQNIYSIGRYGNWEYSSMESAILYGRDMAQKLREKTSQIEL